MRLYFRDPMIQDVVQAVLAHNPALTPRLTAFVYADTVAKRVEERTELVAKLMDAVATSLLLAKTVIERDENKLVEKFNALLTPIRGNPTLAELGLSVVSLEEAAANDVFRDASLISDGLFNSRIARIKALLIH